MDGTPRGWKDVYGVVHVKTVFSGFGEHDRKFFNGFQEWPMRLALRP